jgi:hypothetical protein
MKKWFGLGAVGCLLFCLSTCDRGGPTTPFKPANPNDQGSDRSGVTTTSIVVTSSRGAYFIGETEAFAASLSSSGGAIPITDGTWATDTPEVATVNDAGLVTVVGQGFANISCTHNGLTGSKQVWGRVDCRGAWSGTYSIRRCQIWKDFPDPRFCETHGGSGFPIDLVLTQEGEALRGAITWGGFSIPVVAKPLLDGSLEMEGEVFTDPYWTDVAVGCFWEGSEPKFCMMLYYYTSNHASGQAMLYCDISLCKTGAGS